MNKKYNYIGIFLAITMIAQLAYSQSDSGNKTLKEKIAVDNSLVSDTLRKDPYVRRGKLNNGLTYYIRQNKTKIGNADFMLVNKVGSVNEKDHERGLAHFVEHMAFNGTKNFQKNSIIDYLQQQGIRFGADLNAYTGFDETVYLFPLPTLKQNVVSQGLQILRDWAGDVIFDKVEIDQERGVILEEKRASNSLGKRSMAKILPLTTNNSRYGSRMPIGTDEVLRGFKREDIINFYETWYRPDRQAIIIVGDIDVDKIEQIIEEKFSDLKVKTKNPVPKTDSVRLGAGTQYLVITDPEIVQTELQIGIKNYGQVRNTVAAYRYAVLESLLSSMFANRFMDLSRKSDAPYKNIMVGYGDLFGGVKSTTFTVKPKDGLFEEAFLAGYRELLRVKKFGFTSVEFQQAKRQLSLYFERKVAEKNKQPSASYVDKYKTEFLKGTIAMDIEDEQELGRQFINTISLDEVSAELGKWLKEEDRDMIISAPDDSKNDTPDKATLLGWVNKAEKEQLTPYVAVADLTRLMDPKTIRPGTVVGKNVFQDLNITEIKLNNGVTVVLKPTDFKDDQVLIAAASKGGTSVEADSDFIAANHAAELHNMSGVDSISPSSLTKLLMVRNFRVSPYIAEFEEGMQCNTGKSDVENTLQLMHLYFTKPRIDNNSYIKAMDAMRLSLKDRYKIASNVFSDSLVTWLSNNHPRKRPITEGDLPQLDTVKMRKIYQNRFANASDFTFFVIGSFNVDSIIPLISRYFGALPVQDKKENYRDPRVNWHKGALEKNVFAGTEDKATVMLYMAGSYKNNAKSRLQIQALESTLQNRLLSRLREKESGVYTPSVRIVLSKIPYPRYTIQIDFACAPDNVNYLVAAAREEIIDIQKEGASPEILSKFKKEKELLVKDAQKNNMYWLSVLKNQYLYGDRIFTVREQLDAVEALTAADVKKAANKYLELRNLKKFVLLPKSN